MMKSAIYKYSLWAILCVFFVQSATAQEELTRKISKKHDASKNTNLEIRNIHGKVDVNTWDKKELTVDIEIKATGRRAQEILDKIEIHHEVSGNDVSFETDVNDVNGMGRKSYEINYTVNMPSNCTLELENKYGNVFLDDFQGELDLEVRYGKFRANKLTGDDDKEITVAYGGLDIEELEKGELEVSYSGGEVGKAGNIDMHNKYGSMRFGSVDNLDFETKYGGLHIENSVGTIEGDMGYSKFSAGKLLKVLDMDVKYAGGFEIGEIASGFQRIAIEGSYSSFNLEFANDTNFDFEINTRYGGFNNSLDDRTELMRDIREGQSSEYQGKVGNGGGQVDIDVRYGSVRFR